MRSLWQRFFNQRSLLIIVIMLGVAWFLSLRDGGSGLPTGPVYEQVRLQGDPQCDVSAAPCVKSAKGMRLTLALLDKPSGLRPFPVQVTTEASDALQITHVKLIFSMTGMHMGDLKQSLRREGDQWVGQAILPICTSGRSDWQVQVEVIADKTIYLADYAFTLKK